MKKIVQMLPRVWLSSSYLCFLGLKYSRKSCNNGAICVNLALELKYFAM